MENYTETDLVRLHKELLTILQEIVRICDILNIKCFTLGGTAIGAHYFNGFVKWDDDIDLGMKRSDYELFTAKAPHLVSEGFFVQCLQTDPHTPFYFTKVRKDGTLFVQQEYKDVRMHHGIFVDIFPFDNIPDNPVTAKIHRRLVQYLEGSFLRRQLKQAILEGQASLPAPVSKVLANIRFALLGIIPRRYFYWRLNKVSSLFNGRQCRFVDVIKSSVDRMSADSIENLVETSFEGVKVYAPKDIEAYLKHHYPDLKSPDMLEALWISHAPYMLSFSKDSEL